MKTKLVLWGTNAQEERVLIALQLRANDNKVDIWTFPEAIVTPEFSKKMLDEWRVSAAVIDFPEGSIHLEKELSVTDSLLPDDLRTERTDLIQRAQTEWHFIVLSTKLHESYKSELAQMNDAVTKLTEYSGDVWDSLKGFWGKVQEQVRERNLFREHADTLRDSTNVLFEQLKQMRTTLSSEFEENSKVLYDKFNAILDDIEKKVENKMQRFPDIFDELKKTQSEFRSQKLTKEHSNEIWQRLDNTFKSVKEKRFGNTSNPNNDGSAVERLTHRLEGLINAVDKMQDSINRDKDELSFQTKRMNNSQGQLEAQIRQAKITMIQERVKSKEEKLKDMLSTKVDVESKLISAKNKEAKKEKSAAPVEQPVAVEMTEADVAVAVSAAVATQTAPAAVVEAVAVAEVEETVETIAVAKVEETVEAAPQPVVVETPKAVVEEKQDNPMTEVAADANAALEAVEKLG